MVFDMFRNFIILAGCIIVCACEQPNNNTESASNFESQLTIKHEYNFLNPYAVETKNAKIMVELPQSISGDQGVFDLTLPENAKLYQKNNDEQYVEVRLAQLPVKHEGTVTIKYTLGQNSKAELANNEEDYSPVFAELIKFIEVAEDSLLDYPASLKLVTENWEELQKQLPSETAELINIPGNVDVLQRFIAADFLLSRGAEGDVFAGFACQSKESCTVQQHIMWFTYNQDDKKKTVFLNGEVDASIHLIPVKRIDNRINDFLNNHSGAEGVGVVVTISK